MTGAKRDEEWVRAAAIRALAFYYSQRLIAPMLALRADPCNSSEIRSEAAHSLGMNSPGACGNAALARRLTQYLNDPAPEVRLTVIFATTTCAKRKHALNAIRRLINDHSPAPFWNWTVAQGARRAVTDLQTDLRDETDPLNPVLLTDAWQDRIRLWKIQRRAKWSKRRRR